MIQVIYASAATQPFSPADLKQLLTRARSRNAIYSVSGMLLYHKGSFLQVLEGPEAGVEQILTSVYRDPRHKDPRTLFRGAISTREFQAWSMGFIDTAAVSTPSAGHVDYHSTLPSLLGAATKARQYLRFFQEGLYRQGTEAASSTRVA